ncbi:hypothetical protein C1645_842315 [Glomus cerebriforme]|uniref:Uncharacterized protein n=1 Tax=Glomus cerebriforme TaxID=658196 RepID=A0A397RWR9_9GLOM|nr:hypothetical protein C1645_842315 [Glomus cerebriforme]
MPPIGEDDNYITYDPNNLPMRNHEQFKEQIQQLGRANSNNVQEFGIKERSILFDLQSTCFPDSFPIDIMHLIFENIASYMFQFWTGTFFPKNNNQNNGDYILSKDIWNEIGYKAKEWAAWITIYSLPLLKGRMPERHYEGWAYFVKAVRLCQKFTLTYQELNNIQLLFQLFYNYYEM